MIALRLAPIGALLLLVACAAGPSDPADAGSTDGSEVDAGTPPVREASVALDADPNGLWWDAAGRTLYLADDDGNRILKWTDAAGIVLAADLPAAPADGPGLGQPVRTPDGTIVVPRFGYGTAGDVVFAKADGTTGTVPQLATDRRRIGLTIGGDGSLYDAFFVKVGSARVGTVAKLGLDGTETDVVTALKKPVGVLAVGATLYVSDQDLGQIVKAPIADPGSLTVLATIDGPDLLAAGPEGSVFTGGANGEVRQVSAAGEVTVVRGGLKQPRGVAYDPDGRRLFIANHDGDGSDGLQHTLEIVPVE